MASTTHLRALKIQLDAILALGTPKLSFMAISFTPNSATHQYYSDISASIASGTTAVTLTGVTTTIDSVNNRVELDSDNPSLATVTTTTNKYCLWVDTSNPATSPVLATIDIAEGTLSPYAGTLSITVNAEGHYAHKAV